MSEKYVYNLIFIIQIRYRVGRLGRQGPYKDKIYVLKWNSKYSTKKCFLFVAPRWLVKYVRKKLNIFSSNQLVIVGTT